MQAVVSTHTTAERGTDHANRKLRSNGLLIVNIFQMLLTGKKTYKALCGPGREDQGRLGYGLRRLWSGR